MRQLKPWSARGTSHHPPIWATIIHTFFSLSHPVDEFSVKEIHMWGQPKISSCCLCVWCKSKELGGLGRASFRILSNINDGATLRKYVERL